MEYNLQLKKRMQLSAFWNNIMRRSIHYYDCFRHYKGTEIQGAVHCCSLHLTANIPFISSISSKYFHFTMEITRGKFTIIIIEK